MQILPPSYTQPCIVDGIACGDYKETVQNQNIFAQYSIYSENVWYETISSVNSKVGERVGIGGLHNVCTTYKHCTFYSAIIKVRSSSQCKLHSAVQTDSDRGSPRVGIGGFTRLLPCNYTQLLSIHIASVRAIHTLRKIRCIYLVYLAIHTL